MAETCKTEYERIADETAAAIRKYLPDLDKPGGLASPLHICLTARLGTKLFSGNSLSQGPVQIVVEVVPEAKFAQSD